MQAPHTYSVWQPLSSHLYLWWNRHPRIAEIHVYIHVVDICLLLRSQLPPNCLNAGGIPGSSPCRYPTHILSDNHCHHMCICDGIGTQKSLKFSIYTRSRHLSACTFRTSAKLPQCRRYLDGSPCRYPTHILSDNHSHRMCICEVIGTRKLLKFTFIHTVHTFHCFFALNFRQSPSKMEIFRIPVHAGTPHTFCLATTSIKCVLV